MDDEEGMKIKFAARLSSRDVGVRPRRKNEILGKESGPEPS